jgi:hypothetical protein
MFGGLSITTETGYDCLSHAPVAAHGNVVTSCAPSPVIKKKTKTPWSESASELYRTSDRRLLAK